MKVAIPGVWLIANLIHPMLMYVFSGDNDWRPSREDISIGLMIFMYALIFSLPSLVIGLLAEYLIDKIHLKANVRFVIWLLIGPWIAWLNWLLIFLLAGDISEVFVWSITIPSMLSVILASLIRYRAFTRKAETKPVIPHEPGTHP